MRNAVKISLWAIAGFIAFSLFLSIFMPWKWAVLFVFIAGSIGGFEYLARKYNLAKGRKIFYPAAIILFAIMAIFAKYPWLKDGIEDSQIYYSLKATDAVSKKYPSRLAVVSYKAKMADLEAKSRDIEKELISIKKKRQKGKALNSAEQVFLNSAPAQIEALKVKMEETKFIYKNPKEKEKKTFSFSIPRFSFPRNFGWLQAAGWLIGLAFLVGLALLIFKSTRPAGGKVFAWAAAFLAIIFIIGLIHEFFGRDVPAGAQTTTIIQPADWSQAEEIKSAFVLKAGQEANFKIPYDEYDKFEFIQCGRMGVYSVFDAEGKEHLVSDQVKYLKTDPGEKGFLTIKGGPKDVVLKITKLKVN